VIHSQHNLMVPPASFIEIGRFVGGSRIGVAFPLTILNMIVQSFLSSLAVGGTCCVLTRRDAGGMLEQIDDHRVQFISLVPTTAYDIVHRFADQARANDSLRRVVVGGGHVRPELLRDLAEVFGVDVEHGYGLTEAPTLVTNGVAGIPLNAGRALPHVHVDVRDEAGQPVVDEPGEIVLSTKRDGPWAGVWTPFLGYWGRSTVPRGHPQEVWTADYGRMDASGTLTVLDRRSDIILRGGSNVYPAEIERVVTAHDDVQSAVVVGRAHERLGQVPVAIVELRDPGQVDVAELVAYCRERIAAYKVPDVVIVPEIRRNALGKADRTWARTVAEASSTE
jgi:acyl-CoA synthetase (AMP-forming)/AMP-acid ligase II